MVKIRSRAEPSTQGIETKAGKLKDVLLYRYLDVTSPERQVPLSFLLWKPFPADAFRVQIFDS